MGNIAIEVAVGLFFAFWVLSLIATGVTEWIANALSMRGKFLLRGIKGLLEGKSFELPKELVTIPDPAAATTSDPGVPKWQERVQGLRGHLASYTPAAAGADEAAQAAERVQAATSAALLTEAVVRHPLVERTRRSRQRLGRKLTMPSYIASNTFARAFLDTLIPDLDDTSATTAAKLAAAKETVRKLPVALQRPLLLFLEEAGTDIDKFRSSVEGWFDEQMDRVNGWYKRWAKRIALLIGLAIALLFNASAFDIATTLYREPAVRAALVAQSDACTKPPAETGGTTPKPADTTPKPAAGTDPCASFENLKSSGIPVGWDFASDCEAGVRCLKKFAARPWRDWAQQVAGWLFTAAAISLGAPFWFDAMNRVGSLRKAGKKPEEAEPTP